MITPRFDMSPAAKLAIADRRDEWNRRLPDPATAVFVSWGTFLPTGRPSFDDVVVSFYPVSQRPLIEADIVAVAGEEVVFGASPHLDGMLLDFENERFVLKPLPPA